VKKVKHRIGEKKGDTSAGTVRQENCNHAAGAGQNTKKTIRQIQQVERRMDSATKKGSTNKKKRIGYRIRKMLTKPKTW